MSSRRIAIVAAACRFPEAASPQELWRNVLQGRRSFRDIPASRLDLERYAESRVGASDSITRVKAGLIADWRFDPARFRIPAAAYESADAAHWLALDVAAAALTQSGALNVERTAVVVANTLTGESSRAATLRTRLPFFEDALRAELAHENIDPAAAERIRRRFCQSVQGRFPAPSEETLAGGLANTIAGRIANYFDFRAGAYTVDAACASSLVALANAATLIASEQADAVVVGAVDISLDPFELVGFSRLGALAREDMRVFDARSEGFWPGEGSGFAVLLSEAEAERLGLPVLAWLRGWGISSDGSGGLTRPDVEGQHLALQRAYEMASIDPVDVGYVEAHGTGTPVGDPVEVRALAKLRHSARQPLAIGSIKANIGHTKAAAGLAGLLKTISSLQDGMIAPHVGCSKPHPVFDETGNSIRPALDPQAWPSGTSRIAGVSGFGFGGINAHVVLEQAQSSSRKTVAAARPIHQDAELFVFSGPDRESVRTQLSRLLHRAPTLSASEMTDASAHCFKVVRPGSVRAAVVARTPAELGAGLKLASEALANERDLLDGDSDVFVSSAAAQPRIGFLFPGQAAPVRPDGGCWPARFAHVRPLLGQFASLQGTALVQPVITASSLAALEVLERCGIHGEIALGHSLGELSALAWSGALAREDLLPLAAARGAAMAAQPRGGGMLRVEAARSVVDLLIRGLGLTVACVNAADEVVLSGGADDIAEAERRAKEAGLSSSPLNVSHAFHCALMAGAAAPLGEALHRIDVGEARRPVVSSVTGSRLQNSDDIRALLIAQLTAPVRFHEALELLAPAADFLIEVGPGGGLSRLAGKAGIRALALDAFAESLAPLLRTLGYAFVRGAPVDLQPIFDGRAVRPIEIERVPHLLSSACAAERPADQAATPPASTPAPATSDALAAVMKALAEETGLPADQMGAADRLLDDLHLSSIAVARLTARAARSLGVRIPRRVTDLANATVGELASTLQEAGDFPAAQALRLHAQGVAPWVRPYAVQWVAAALPQPARAPLAWTRVGSGGPLAGEDLGTAERGVLIWMDDDAEPRSCVDLVAQCQAAARSKSCRHLAICHAGLPLAGFARSIFLEGLFVSVTLIERPRGAPDGIADAELAVELRGFCEIRMDGNGGRFVPALLPARVELHASPAIDRRDVVLFTGGAKGIGAECAIRLAEMSGCALVLVGRSPADAPDVRRTLERLVAGGMRHRYVQADVTRAADIADKVATAAKDLGAVTVLIHSAAANEPHRFLDLRREDVEQALLPKIDGLLSSVSAAGPALRRVITFGSIINRVGLEGEAHYALANGWMAEAARRLPQGIQTTNLEWSVWSGAGMAERLGAIERLAERGVSAISVDEALRAFERLALSGATGDVIVTSRFGSPVGFAGASGPAIPMRFVDKPLLHYPQTELIVETEVSLGRDPYLADHRPGGMSIFPGVMALEAMAQAACALHGSRSPQAIEDIRFSRAVLFADARPVTLRIAALAEDEDSVRVAVRASDDAFASERFAGRFRFGPAAEGPAGTVEAVHGPEVDPAPLYGSLYFHSGRFRRLAHISHVCARGIEAAISPSRAENWFSSFEPQSLVLGDPGARDAGLHALQACVPHRRVYPVAVKRVRRGASAEPAALAARERHADGRNFVFDVRLIDARGNLVESWEQATFRAVEDLDATTVLADAPGLTGAYIERVARERLADSSIRVAMVSEEGMPKERRRDTALHALGVQRTVVGRSDGKALLADGSCEEFISISHRDPVTIAVKAAREIGCDIELVRSVTPHEWPAVLPDGLLASAGVSEEPTEITCARLWTVFEGARKLGAAPTKLFVNDDGRGSAGPVVIDGDTIQSVTIPFSGGAGLGVVGVSLMSAPRDRTPDDAR